jgi:hypothetical protein
LLGVGGGVDADIAFLVDRKEVGTPVVYIIDLGRISDIPFFHDIDLQRSSSVSRILTMDNAAVAKVGTKNEAYPANGV